MLFNGFKFNVVEKPNLAGEQHQIIEMEDAVTILPILEDGRILLLRHYRPALSKEILEIPAGTMDVAGESAIDCAARELDEETGYQGTITPLCKFYTSPGCVDEIIQAFVATNIIKVNDNLGLENEGIKGTISVTWADFWRMVDSGEIMDAKTIIAAQQYFSRLDFSRKM